MQHLEALQVLPLVELPEIGLKILLAQIRWDKIRLGREMQLMQPQPELMLIFMEGVDNGYEL